mgnify:CR=1 FL=1
MKEIEDNKVYYSWKDYNKDMKAIEWLKFDHVVAIYRGCLLYTSPSPRDQRGSRLPCCA